MPAHPPPASSPSTAPAPLAFLIGTWQGRGRGIYPTITPFDYTERIEVLPTAKPVLRYAQQTASAETGAPLHAESGWLRVVEGIPEMVIAQATGIVEVHQGELTDNGVVWRSGAVGLTSGAQGHRVREVVRQVTVDGDTLTYQLLMAAVGQPLQLHLEAVLTREEP